VAQAYYTERAYAEQYALAQQTYEARARTYNCAATRRSGRLLAPRPALQRNADGNRGASALALARQRAQAETP
jgi:multidrug efflux system outer membrane protein